MLMTKSIWLHYYGKSTCFNNISIVTYSIMDNIISDITIIPVDYIIIVMFLICFWLSGVVQGLNLAANAFLRWSLGPEYSAKLLALMEMPKQETHLSLDFSSLLGPIFYCWLAQLLLPLLLVTLVYEKQHRSACSSFLLYPSASPVSFIVPFSSPFYCALQPFPLLCPLPAVRSVLLYTLSCVPNHTQDFEPRTFLPTLFFFTTLTKGANSESTMHQIQLHYRC